MTVEPYKFGDERDAWLDDLRRVMADVKHFAREKSVLIRGHIRIGLSLDGVDGKWQKLTKLTSTFPIDWKAVRKECEFFPSRADLSKG